MRVIAGTRRSLLLKTPDGNVTRPTTDRIKETLFNVLQTDVQDSIFVDLFSGSGAIGIEALSRGAKKAYFIEMNKEAISCIQDNIKFTKFTEQAVVLKQEVVSGLEFIKEPVDIIFMDPPYDQLLEKTILDKLSKTNILKEDSMIIVEASLKTEFDYLEELGFVVLKEKKYKTNKHVFIGFNS